MKQSEIQLSENQEVRSFMKKIGKRNPHELEFLQAVQEVTEIFIRNV
jgi:hypothetical protein